MNCPLCNHPLGGYVGLDRHLKVHHPNERIDVLKRNRHLDPHAPRRVPYDEAELYQMERFQQRARRG
jgi:hypothetical protein